MADLEIKSQNPATITPPGLQLRLATHSDIPALESLIDSSVRALHTTYYTPAQISSALRNIYGVDTQLIEDGTYFLIHTTASPGGFAATKPLSDNASSFRVVACGGWSFRRTLYGGDQFESRDGNLLDPKTDAAKIRAFFVHPEYVRRGLGNWLLRACEEKVREMGFRKVEIGATLAGVEFYTRAGYKVMVDEKGGNEAILMEDREVLNIMRMEKVMG
jgi:GNAT superfamily N-acetyltransferase